MTSLKVTGMHCEGCENRIQKVIEKIESVSNVKADREAEKVEFDFDGSADTITAVKSKINELGYKIKE